MANVSLSSLLNRLLGGRGEILPRQRHQDPTPQQRSNGTWFFIARVEVIRGGKLDRPKQTIDLPGEFKGKREARAAVREAMKRVNNTNQVLISQVRVSDLLEQYDRMHIAKQASTTRGKYRSHIRNHIRPAFGDLMLCELAQPLLIQKWLDAKAEADPAKKQRALSWATRTDLRNILSSMFTQAKVWQLWDGENPIGNVHAGRKKTVREKRKLADEQTTRLLAALPYDLRVGCCVCLFCTLRVSEMLGLQEKHLNFEEGRIAIRQRYARGDLDEVKSEAARRTVPMGYLANDLKNLCKGDPERFVFQIQTRPEWGNKQGVCRDDRDLQQHFLRPAAKALGFYWKGFGFHSLRREAVTAIGSVLGIGQAMKMAGHTSADMSILYTLSELQEQDRAIRARQEIILGKPEGKVQ